MAGTMRAATTLALAGLALSCAALAPSPAAANTTPVVADVGTAWEHAATGTAFPVELAGFTRSRIEDFGKAQLDIGATYTQESSDTEATLYLFHAGLVDASVWHDRILAVVNSSGRLGQIDQQHSRSGTFTPSTGEANAGLRTVMPLTGSKLKATGIAIYPVSDWLIAIQMTSRDLDQAALDAQLAAFAQSIHSASPPAAKTPVAYLIGDCATALPQKQAKLYPPSMMDALLGASLGAAQKDAVLDEEAHPAEGTVWCRDASSNGSYGVYRANGSDDSFIVALGDSGATASVGIDGLAGVLGGHSKAYMMQFRTVDRMYAFRRFNRLPAASQVVEMIEKDAPISSSTRGTGNTTITLSPSAGKSN